MFVLDTNTVTLIAATALRHNAMLVTHNVEEFERVEGLAVRDWYE